MKKKTSLSKKVGGIATKENVKKSIVKANEAGNFIVENKNAFIIGGGLVLGFLAVRQVRKSFSSIGDALKADDVDFIKPKINPSSNNLTITSDEAVNLAKTLLDAFNDGGTDEEKVEAVFKKLQTGDDFKLVFNAFGLRKRIFGGTPTNYFTKKAAEAYDLIYWLKAEIGTFWNPTLYNIIKKRVESAGLIF